MSLLLLVLPKHAGELSELEFRTLADYPFRGKSLDTVASEVVKGEASKNVDKFLEDHYPGRSFFIALNSYYLRLTGRNADQAVVQGKNDRLYDAPVKAEGEFLEKNIDKINAFTEANGLSTVLVAVPSSAVLAPSELPLLHLDTHDEEYLSVIRERSSAYVADVAGIFDGGEGLMYRTDHHWTMSGAYLVYRDIVSHYGAHPVSRDIFSAFSYNFYGSFYRKAGLWLTKPDMLEVWRCPELDAMTTTVGWGTRAVTHEGVYDESQLAGTDKYAAYLWSNNDITVIENPNGNGETVMLVKDSFGNSIAPLIALNYSRVVMIDTRYYRSPDLPMPSELAAEYGIEKLIVVLGMDSMVSDITIAYLR